MELDSETYLLPQQRNKSKNIKTWYGGIVKNGVTRWVSLKTKNYSIAMEWYNNKQASRFSPKKEQKPSIKIEEAMEAYLADLEKVRRTAKGTIKGYKCCLNLFLAWCKKKSIADIGKITAPLCFEYAKDELTDKTKNTASVRIVALRGFFKWVTQYYNIDERNPFTGIVIQKPKSEPRKFWTLEECEKIIEVTSDEEYKLWFAFMAFAGLRKEEARQLKMENIEGGKISLIGKGGKAATIPISSRLKEHLNKYLALRGDAPGLLFPKLGIKTDYNNNFGMLITKWAKIAGVSNADTAHLHRFRHSFASNLLRAGKSIKAVQMLMRHENVTLTLNIYGHLLPSDLEKEIEL